jgi:hypothetical protein
MKTFCIFITEITLSKMKRYYSFVLLVALFIQCEEKVDYIKKCPFAPPESNWSSVSPCGSDNCNYDCSECELKVNFRGKNYVFKGNQLDRSYMIKCQNNTNCYSSVEWYNNPFMTFLMVIPEKKEEFLDKVGVKTALVRYDSLIKLDRPPFETSLRIQDYCSTYFEPNTGQPVEESYHVMNTATLADSLTWDTDTDKTQVEYSYLCTGEFRTNIDIDGNSEPLNATYKIEYRVIETHD